MQPELRFRRLLFLFILALIWGSSFILMKWGLIAFRADQVAAIRMAVAFTGLLPFVLRHLGRVPPRDLKWIFATGVVGNGIPAFLFAFAQTRIDSAVAGILNSLTPVFVVLLGFLFFGSRFRRSHFLGVTIGLAGAAGLVLVSHDGHLDTGQFRYSLLVILATVGYATSVNIMRNKLHDVKSIVMTAFALVAAGPPCLVYLLCTDFTERLASPDGWYSFAAVATLALLGTAFSTVLFTSLIKISNALYASSVTYLIPVVALVWGIVDGEAVGWLHVVALGGILLGVYLINLESVRDRVRAARAGTGGHESQ
jgi:drug/metabolite transporter (DMT)-like permease